MKEISLGYVGYVRDEKFRLVEEGSERVQWQRKMAYRVSMITFNQTQQPPKNIHVLFTTFTFFKNYILYLYMFPYHSYFS